MCVLGLYFKLHHFRQEYWICCTASPNYCPESVLPLPTPDWGTCTCQQEPLQGRQDGQVIRVIPNLPAPCSVTLSRFFCCSWNLTARTGWCHLTPQGLSGTDDTRNAEPWVMCYYLCSRKIGSNFPMHFHSCVWKNISMRTVQGMNIIYLFIWAMITQ